MLGKLMTPALNAKGTWALGTLLLLVFAISFGRMDTDLEQILQSLKFLPPILRHWLFETPMPGEMTPQERIFLLVRLPRIITAFIVGAAMAMAGCVYQGVFRNPLVSPDILGVSSGCIFGAALGLLLPGSYWLWIQGLAFFFGLSAVVFAMAIAWRFASNSLLMMIMTGIIISSLFGAALTLLKALADPFGELPAIIFWLMGSLSSSTWDNVLQLTVPVALLYLVVHLCRYRLNILCLGDVQSRSLGINPTRFRLLLLAVSSLMVALCVSSVGQVAWIGLVIPHMVRTFTGANHLSLVPLSALCGGLFLLFADTMARSLFSLEVPISVVTSVIGAPLFAWLLFRYQRKHLC